MLLVANIPARLIAQKLPTLWPIALLFLTAGICFVLSEFGWRYAMRHYTSASS